MHPVLRRIAIHGGLTAVLLAVLGIVFASLASMWLASPPAPVAPGEPVVTPDADGELAAVLRTRVPLLMAAWGFGLVALGEVVLHLKRSRKPAPPPAPPQPDDAEQLLDQILTEVESRGPGTAAMETVKGSGDMSQETVQGTGDRRQEAEGRQSDPPASPTPPAP